MQPTRKHLTLGLLAVVALMAIATLAGHPIIPAEAIAALGVLPFAMTGELDTKGLTELLEKQGQAFQEFKTTNDELIKAKADGKAVADLEAKLSKLNTAFDDTQAQLKALEKRQGRPGTGGEIDPAKAEHKAAFGAFLRKGDDGNLADLQKKAYNITTEGDGGYAQQSVIVQLIGKHREQLNRYLMHFGLSPAARGRVQASNYVQPTLPGIEEKPMAKPAGFAMFTNPNR